MSQIASLVAGNRHSGVEKKNSAIVYFEQLQLQHTTFTIHYNRILILAADSDSLK